jgi:tetratricopeptide (TPR) repeat protein
MSKAFEINDKRYKYRAFISYSHKDIKFAKYLQKSIEQYKIPNILRHKYPSLPENLQGSTYLSKEESNKSTELSREAKAALKFSHNLMYVSGLNSDSSKNVASELAYFKQEHGDNRIFAINNDKKNKTALLKSIASILNVDFNDLMQSSKSTAKVSKKKKPIFVLGAVALLIVAYFSMQSEPKTVNKEMSIIKNEIVLLEEQLSTKENSKDEINNLSMALTSLEELKDTKKEIIRLFDVSNMPFIEDVKKVYDEDGVSAALFFMDASNEKLKNTVKARKNLIKAKLYMEMDNSEEANTFYEKASKIEQSYENMYGYALFLEKQNKLTQAEIMLEDLLKIELSKERRANVLNSLGLLYVKSGMFKEAKKVYDEALEIREELASKDAKKYNADLALSYNNLAVLYKQMQNYEESEKTHLKALKIREELAVSEPDVYTSSVGTSLHNLAQVYERNKNMKNAEEFYEKSLKIRRELVKKNAHKYTPYLVNTLDELALLYVKDDAKKKAESMMKEALEIRKELYLSNPLEFAMPYYDTLTNLHALYKRTMQEEKAKDLYDSDI